VAELTKSTPEDRFRETLQDVIVLAQVLKPFCRTAEELADMAEMALYNNGQLRLLMRLVSSSQDDKSSSDTSQAQNQTL